jgi:hypothetical protein
VLQIFELVMQIADAPAARDRLVEHRAARHFLDVLAEIPDRQLLRDGDLALVRAFLAGDHPKIVVLPAPFGPTSPAFSPGFNWNEASTKRTCLPYCLLMLANAIM